jgi:hypothetical protein
MSPSIRGHAKDVFKNIFCPYMYAHQITRPFPFRGARKQIALGERGVCLSSSCPSGSPEVYFYASPFHVMRIHLPLLTLYAGNANKPKSKSSVNPAVCIESPLAIFLLLPAQCKFARAYIFQEQRETDLLTE